MRKQVFNILDKVRGTSINKVVDRLENYTPDTKEYAIFKEKLIQDFLSNACKTEFYKKYSGKQLNEFPIVSKKTIKENVAAFKNPIYSDRDLVKVHTSGSYGTPFEFTLTRQKKVNQLAEVIASGHLINYEVGDKHIYCRSENSKSSIKLFAQNEIFISCKRLDEAFLSQSREILKQKNVKVWIGFASVISRLAEYCLSKGDTPSDFKLAEGGVISSSEDLSASQRDVINKVFGCKICSRYSTEETGVLANQIEKDGPFYINSLHYIIEILKLDRDEAAEPGEIGRIVLTDLYSDAMPLIRYDIGDLALVDNVKYDSLGNLTQFSSLSGRKVQIIMSPSGSMLYPLNLENIVEKYLDIIQYQFIQESKDTYRLLIVSNKYDSLDLEGLRGKILLWLGEHATVYIEKVDQIKALPSGKRPYIINQYLQNV